MLTHLLIAIAVAAPFRDAHKRFAIDLPPGWVQGPLPAGADGATFRCTIDGEVALAAIRVLKTISTPNAASVAREITGAVASQPGFQLIEEGSSDLAGKPAARRRYVVFVDGNREMVKIAEDQVVVAHEVGYVLHVESLQTSFFRFLADFDHLGKSFALGPDPRGAELTQSPVMGRWQMKDATDTFLDLRADGVFDLAGTMGTYRVEGANLLMWTGDGHLERFGWHIDRGELLLRSVNLGEVMRYQRAKSGMADLEGVWRGRGQSLQLGPGDAAKLDEAVGNYEIDGKTMVLRLAGKRRVVAFELNGDTLVVRGGPFGKGLTLHRKNP